MKAGRETEVVGAVLGRVCGYQVSNGRGEAGLFTFSSLDMNRTQDWRKLLAALHCDIATLPFDSSLGCFAVLAID